MIAFNNTRETEYASFGIERDCCDRTAWDAYIHTRQAAVNYHRYAWRAVVENSFGHRCYYLTAKDGSGAMVGILPLVFMKSTLFGCFLVSLPFFNYGGLLSDTQEIGTALLREAAALRGELGAAHVELRHTEPWPGGLPTKQAKVSMLLDLGSDSDLLWKGFNAKLRNQVRKAEKSGCTAVVGGLELLTDYYTVFVRNMRDLGTPVYGKKFFANILTAFPEESRIIAVYLEGKPVAAG